MIVNIVDSRTRKYRWKRVQAIVEAVWHDNACNDSDQADVGDELDESYVLYEERNNLSLTEAVAWAMSLSCPVTLYLYDPGGTDKL